MKKWPWIVMLCLAACAEAPIVEPADEPAVAPESPRPASILSLESTPHRRHESGNADVHILAQGKNAFVGKLIMAGDGVVPEHQDATEEYIHVLEGGGTILIDGTTHEIGPGSTVYMPANAVVSYQNGPEQLVAIQIFAGPEPATKYDAWHEVGVGE